MTALRSVTELHAYASACSIRTIRRSRTIAKATLQPDPGGEANHDLCLWFSDKESIAVPAIGQSVVPAGRYATVVDPWTIKMREVPVVGISPPSPDEPVQFHPDTFAWKRAPLEHRSAVGDVRAVRRIHLPVAARAD